MFIDWLRLTLLLSFVCIHANTLDNTFTIRHNVDVKQFGDHKNPIIHQALKVDSEGFLESYNNESDDAIYLRMEGNFRFSNETDKDFYFNLTWAKAKLWIDDQLIVEVARCSHRQIPYHFSPGTHRVKIVVYNTDSPAAIVHLGMTDHQSLPLNDGELSAKLKELIAEKPIRLNYFYQWRSKTVNLKDSATDSILFITSFKPAIYTIRNTKRARLKAIIYSGEGVEFRCDVPVSILHAEKIPEAPNLSPDITKCSSALGGLICPDEQNFRTLNEWIKSVAGKPLDGFTGSGKPDELPLIVPEIVLDQRMYRKLQETQNAIQAKRDYLTQASSDPYFIDSNVSWAEVLKIKNDTIPTNKFRAFYMDKNDPKKIRYSETVDTLSLTYSHTPFHTIAADNFLGLWIGNFEFERDTKLTIGLSLSWAHIRLTDNGTVIYDGGDSSAIEHTFTKGTHRIEAEYINNYGQVDVNLGFVESVPIVDETTIRGFITPDTNVYLFGGYESDRNDHGIDLELKNSSRSVVLFLSSYETLNYTIRNVLGGKLKAIIYNAYEPLGTIHTDAPVPIYRDNGLHYCDRLIPFSYKPTSDYFENKSAFPDIVSRIKTLTGIKPVGFSATYEPSLSHKRLERMNANRPIPIPQIILDEGMYQKIEDRLHFLETH